MIMSSKYLFLFITFSVSKIIYPKTKFIEIEQENNKYKDFILQNNLNKNFENFGKIEDKDNNLPFNFSRA